MHLHNANIFVSSSSCTLEALPTVFPKDWPIKARFFFRLKFEKNCLFSFVQQFSTDYFSIFLNNRAGIIPEPGEWSSYD